MMCICVILTVAFVALLVYLALGRKNYNITVSKSLEGKTIIVTGAEQGRGFQITLELVKKKARVIMACADDNKGRKARQNIVQRTGNTDVVVQHLDVTMMSSVRFFVAWFKEHEKKLDMLINNKEMITIQKTMTEGTELIFAANYLGPFLLTTSMLDLLKKCKGRIVNVGSVLPKCRFTEVDWENLKAEKCFNFSRFYESKVALMIFTKELAKRTINSGIVVSYVNTGLVEIDLYRDISWLFLLCQSLRKGQGLKSATEGALSVLFCALDGSVQTGGCYSNGQLIDHTPSLPVSVYDEGLAKKLWEASERLTGTFEERKITSGTKISNGRKIERYNCKTDIMSELESILAKRGRAE